MDSWEKVSQHCYPFILCSCFLLLLPVPAVFRQGWSSTLDKNQYYQVKKKTTLRIILYLSFSFSCFNFLDNQMERQRSPLESDTVNEPASVESIFFSLINITWMTKPALLLSECSTLLVWMHWPLCKQCNHSQGGWSLLCTSGQLARLPLIPRAPNTWGSQYQLSLKHGAQHFLLFSLWVTERLHIIWRKKKKIPMTPGNNGEF